MPRKAGKAFLLSLFSIICCCNAQTQFDVVSKALEFLKASISLKPSTASSFDTALTAQALAYQNVSEAMGIMHDLFKSHQHSDGFMPAWINDKNSSTIIASKPVHATAVLSILNQIPVGHVLGKEQYAQVGLSFLCKMYPLLQSWHSYLITTRLDNITTVAKNSTSDKLFAITHPSEGSFNNKGADNDLEYRVYDVEFNSILLRSLTDFIRIERILKEHFDSCPSVLQRTEKVKDVVNDVTNGILNSKNGLWNEKLNLFQSKSSQNEVVDSSSLSLVNMMPLYAINFDKARLHNLMSHFFSSGSGIAFSGCDNFGITFYPCGSSTTSARLILPLYSYWLIQGLQRNGYNGMATYFIEDTIGIFRQSLSINRNVSFSSVFDANTGYPLMENTTNYCNSSILGASIFIMTALPPHANTSPDDPPIDRSMTTIVMYVELVLAFGVAVSCLLFSIYFIVTRPPESSVGIESSESSHTLDTRKHDILPETSRASYGDSYGSFSRQSTDTEDRFRSSTIDSAAETGGGGGNGGVWESFNDFVSVINPWK